MSETPAPSDPGPHARFPWGPALLCAGCIATATCLWMAYSYAWSDQYGLGPYWSGKLVCSTSTNPEGRRFVLYGRVIIRRSGDDRQVFVTPFLAGDSRLTGQSVAGIAVGAMGALVFGLYLRAWLRERRAGFVITNTPNK